MNSASRKTEDPARKLSLSLRNHGIVSFGFLGQEALTRITAELPAETRARYGLAGARGAAAAALPYDTTGFPAGTLDPDRFRDSRGRLLGDLGWFARSNWYRELARLLEAAAEDVRGIGSWPKSAFRIAVNSRLPEKTLAAAAGLGLPGRNTLLLNRLLGPGCVLGILLLPFEPDASARTDSETSCAPGSACGDCDACVRACPTGAILPGGGIVRERCLQYWASTDSAVPPKIASSWRGNLYGCDLCLAACPRFRPGIERTGKIGALGAGLPLETILLARDDGIRASLRGTALGLGWITPALIKRNALLAAASRLSLEAPGALERQEPEIRMAAERLVLSEDSSLASAAAFLLNP